MASIACFSMEYQESQQQPALKLSVSKFKQLMKTLKGSKNLEPIEPTF